MNVASVSVVRDAAEYLPRFLNQLDVLRCLLHIDGHTFRAIVIEGDSTDATWPVLQGGLRDRKLSAALAQHHHGGPAFGSIEHPQRWAQVAEVYNVGLDGLTESDDWVLHVEADLVWQPATLARLLGMLRDYDAVAPLVMLRPNWFYDTYGFRTLDGRHFLPTAPYHPDGLDGLTEISAAGSCVAVRGVYARAARWSPVDVSVGWWRDMRALGARLWCDPGSRVEHP